MNAQTIRTVSEIFSNAAKTTFGNKLHSIILFGSCARGDYNQDSDVDLMVLLNVNRNDLPAERGKLCKVCSDLGLDYDVLISPVFEDTKTFTQFLPVLPFYQNVMKEGVKIV